MNRAKLMLGVLVLGLAGLVVFTGVRAEEQPQTDPPRKAAPENTPMPMAPVVKPKPLSDEIKKGLEYLVKQQHANGGWGQGGGWRTVDQGGRIEGANVQDPPDVGNTCIALLALIRAGNTPQEGPYSKNVAKGVEFICTHVEKADKDSLLVTDVKGTQLQSKIGPYVDTFLTSLVFSQLKGKMQDKKNEDRAMAALKKTIAKIEKNQQKDGTFVGNDGWASVLSQGLANKGLNYAAQMGVQVQPQSIMRVQDQVAKNFDTKAGAFKPGSATPYGLGLGGFSGAPSTAPSDAGIPLYQASSNLTNSADVLNTYRVLEQEAQKTLQKKDATKEEKSKAEATIKKAQEVRTFNDKATESVVKQIEQPGFVQGFGSNGGEEFLSFMNIGEALLLKGGDEWKKWDDTMTKAITRVQNPDGSWSGHHCITGKTFCTGAALLVLMTDRTPMPAAEKKEEKK